MNKLELMLGMAALLLPAALSADATTLRAGLWEITFKSDVTPEQARHLAGKIPETLLAKLPAAQRAEFKRSYESGELLRTELNSSDTLCITEDDLEHGIQPGTDLDAACTRHSADTHKTWQEVQFRCEGLQPHDAGNAVVRIVASDPTTLDGSIIRISAAARPFSIKAELHGTWLDSQCGDEAPEEDESRPR